MKHRKSIYGLLSILIVFSTTLSAQDRHTKGISYLEEKTERIKVHKGLEVNTLTMSEKLKFKVKKYSNVKHKYFDNENDVVTEIHFVSQENKFPRWYNHPEIIRMDNTGTKSFFLSDNPHLPNGWAGGSTLLEHKGLLKKDPDTGERYLHLPLEGLALEMYRANNALVKENGFVSNISYSHPTADDIKLMQENGFEIYNYGTKITATNSYTLIEWNSEDKTISKREYESSGLENTVVINFEFVPEFEAYLISSSIEFTPQEFENGGCYELVQTTTYSNYQTGYGDGKTLLSNNSIETLEVYPIPTSEMLNIFIPGNSEKAILQISTINGEILVERHLSNQSGDMKINISSFPTGIYVIKLNEGSKQYINKIVKQ